MFVVAVSFFSCSALKCVSMNDQECKIRPEVINSNSDNLLFYSCSTEVTNCGGSCNNIDNPYAKSCVPDVVKNINAKVFSLISRINETRHIE